jgi:hypothetical protein
MVTECERELARRLADTKAEIERLRAERDALIDALIGAPKNDSLFYDALIPFQTPFGLYKVEASTASYATKADAVAVIRRAAGLDPEAAP